MGGDLNLKKSWHPTLMSNQKRVWEEEKKALDERKKIDQIMKERAEERRLQEVQDMQEAAGGIKRQQRVEWMYSGPSGGQNGATEETEAYLLGKRRVDNLLQGKEKENLQKASGQESFMALQNANTARDTASKIRDDPLLAIKKQEQAAYEAMMNDPVKRRMLLRAADKEDKTSSREHKRHKRSHHHEDDRKTRHRHSRYKSDRYDEEERNHHSQRRRSRSGDRSDSRSVSPPSRRSRRSVSPRRSQSRESPRDRSRSPYRPRDSRHSERDIRNRNSSVRVSHQKSRAFSQRSTSPNRQREMEDRLAAMQQDANHLEAQRQRRLEGIAERERADALRDEEARARTAKYGNRADFVNGYQKRAVDMSLGEHMGRSGHRSRAGED